VDIKLLEKGFEPAIKMRMRIRHPQGELGQIWEK